VSKATNGRRALIHIDSVSPHRPKLRSNYLKEFIFRPLPHHPFWAALAGADFYLFGPIKAERASSEFGSAEEVVSDVTDATSLILHVTLTNVFGEWEQRPQKCINVEGAYIT
jgi:hypothetical protein